MVERRVYNVEDIDNERGTTQRVIQENSINNKRGVTQRVIVVGGIQPVIEELNVTPSTSAQTITAPEGTDGYSPVNVSAVTSSIDANIVAGNIKKDVEILGVTGSYEGSAGGKYQMFQRIKDDTDKDIGIVVGFRKDENNKEYAVVCLNKEYRTTTGYACFSDRVTISTLSEYLGDFSNFTNSTTATYCGDKILEFAAQNNYSSAAVTRCRTFSFVIDGITYAGQLPTISELSMIVVHADIINNNDPSQTGATIISTNYWSCTQATDQRAWYLNEYGTINYYNKNTSYRVLPILELPNE